MLLDCLASCTRCLTPRRERRAADQGDGDPAVPVPAPVPVPVSFPGPVAVAPEAVPGAAQVPTANGDPCHSPEPPFETYLCCTTDTADVTIRVTVDYSVPVNVVTAKCLKGLGLKPLRKPLPAELSDRAAKALPGHRGWRQLTLHSPSGHRGLTRTIEFVVVGDDYPCDLLLGAEFQGVSFKPGAGLYPNHTKPLSKEEERKWQEQLAQEAAGAAARKSQIAKRLEEGNKKDPKSGDGAGEGTSASHTRGTTA